MSHVTDLLIIGGGPAGLSAAIYTARAGISTVVAANGDGALARASEIGNYFGIKSVSGAELLKIGREQAVSFGAKLVSDEITSLTFDGDAFEAGSPADTFRANAVLFATGQSRRAPRISGIEAFEGAGVSYCAVCDAFFFKGKRVGVLGNGLYALSEARELVPHAASVTVFTNGAEPEADFSGFNVVTAPLESLDGNDSEPSRLGYAIAENGDRYPTDGLFIALGHAGSADFARKLGLPVNPDGTIAAEPDGSTMLPGVYAAGDCRGGVLQVSKAVGEGAVAALKIIEYVRKKRSAAK